MLGVMLVIVGIHSYNLWQKQSNLKAERAQLEQELAEEYARTEELKEFRKYVQTDSYAEEVAQDKLGLVHEGEIVFEIQR
ncbi:MAG: septum formation initiator family protein [Lachnospiraceae bacterium]|nr:septum formation initiator family protein [Lachnospiraceae bacterium]